MDVRGSTPILCFCFSHLKTKRKKINQYRRSHVRLSMPISRLGVFRDNIWMKWMYKRRDERVPVQFAMNRSSGDR